MNNLFYMIPIVILFLYLYLFILLLLFFFCFISFVANVMATTRITRTRKLASKRKQTARASIKRAAPSKSPTPSLESSFQRFISRVTVVFNFPTIVYLSCIILLYLNHVDDPENSNLKYLLQYLDKFTIIQPLTTYFATYPNKLFAVFIFSTILINARRTTAVWSWFLLLVLVSFTINSQPIAFYVLQAFSVISYIKTNNQTLLNTAFCLAPLVYYFVFHQSLKDTVSGNAFNDNGNASYSDTFDNYTLPPIDLNLGTPVNTVKVRNVNPTN